MNRNRLLNIFNFPPKVKGRFIRLLLFTNRQLFADNGIFHSKTEVGGRVLRPPESGRKQHTTFSETYDQLEPLISQ